MSHISIKINEFNKNDFDTNDFDTNNFDVLKNYFQIKKNGKLYIVTVHNYLPISDEIYLEEKKLKICINSKWNELLILKNDELISDAPLIDLSKVSNVFLSIDSDVKISNMNGKIIEYTYYTYGNLPNYPNIIYIKIRINCDDNLLPGSPVYDENNNLIGIVSFAIDYVYCLPVYYLIRTFKKDNNISIPNIPLRIDKINNNIVKGIYIYNSKIRYSIPIDCHFLLEPNSKIFVKNNNAYEKIDVPFLRYNDKSLIKNNRKIVKMDDKYEISISTLYLLRYLDMNLAVELYSFINRNENFNDYHFSITRGHLRFSLI